MERVRATESARLRRLSGGPWMVWHGEEVLAGTGGVSHIGLAIVVWRRLVTVGGADGAPASDTVPGTGRLLGFGGPAELGSVSPGI
jgi:hypothetical protein